jgi:hypothetical protein
MPTLEKSFLSIDGQAISLTRCLGYLGSSGHLGPFLGEMLRQYVLEREFARRPEIVVSETLVEIAIADFCDQRQLTDQKMLDGWLLAHDESRSSIATRIRAEFKFEKLKYAISSPDLGPYFLDRQPFLDRVVLSRILVDHEEDAQNLKDQFATGAAFDEAAAATCEGGEMMRFGALERIALPMSLRQAVAGACVGEVLGPISSSNGWALYLFEEDAPASLSDPALKQALRDELFERWIGEQLEHLTVELQLEGEV